MWLTIRRVKWLRIAQERRGITRSRFQINQFTRSLESNPLEEFIVEAYCSLPHEIHSTRSHSQNPSCSPRQYSPLACQAVRHINISFSNQSKIYTTQPQNAPLQD